MRTSVPWMAVESPMSVRLAIVRTFTLAPPGSFVSQRPFGISATPSGTPSPIASSTVRAPSSLVTRTRSPATRPRLAASLACIVTVITPSRPRTLRSFENVAFIVHGEAGDSSRSRPSAGGSSACGWGTRAWPSASAAALAISMRPLGVSNTPSANWSSGRPVG